MRNSQHRDVNYSSLAWKSPGGKTPSRQTANIFRHAFTGRLKFMRGFAQHHKPAQRCPSRNDDSGIAPCRRKIDAGERLSYRRTYPESFCPEDRWNEPARTPRSCREIRFGDNAAAIEKSDRYHSDTTDTYTIDRYAQFCDFENGSR